MSGRNFQRTIKSELTKRRFKEADVRFRIYVRPFGNRGLHIIKNKPDGVEYKASGPMKTFAPGTIIPTGSYTSTQGEVIIAQPPPGRRGASRTPSDINTLAGPGTFTLGVPNGGVTGISTSFPGGDINFGVEECTKLVEGMFFEVFEETNAAGTPKFGLFVITEVTIVTADQFTGVVINTDTVTQTGSEEDPHPGFRIRVWNAPPPVGNFYLETSRFYCA